MDKTIKVFLSHNYKDKPFVRKLADNLESHGLDVFLDERKIKAGDSIISSIGTALEENDIFIVVLSNNSINAPWVKEELKIAINRRLDGQCKIIPVIIDDSDVPLFLKDYLYVDFRKKHFYYKSYKYLLDSIIFDDVFLEKYKNIYPGNAVVELAIFDVKIDELNTGLSKFHEEIVLVPIRPTHKYFKEISINGELISLRSNCRSLKKKQKGKTVYSANLNWKHSLPIRQEKIIKYDYISRNEFKFENSWYYNIEAPTKLFKIKFRFHKSCAPDSFLIKIKKSLLNIKNVNVLRKVVGEEIVFERNFEFPKYGDQYEFEWS